MNESTIERPQLTDFDLIESTREHYRPDSDATMVESIDIGWGEGYCRIPRKKIYKLKVIINDIPERLQLGGAIGCPTLVRINDVEGELEVVSQKVKREYNSGTERWTLEER